MSYKIKQIDKDDRFETRVMEVSIFGKKIVTPSKTIDKTGVEGEINEFSVRISEKDIVSAYENTNAKLNQLSNNLKPDAINVLIPEYQDYNLDSVNNVESRIHENTDIIVVPRWKGVLSLSDGNLKEDLIRYTKQFIEETRKLNGKLIMGNLPINKPQSVINGLLNFYLNEGITSFVLDYGTCSPLNKSHVVRDVQKVLIDADEYENSILFSTNVRRTHNKGGMYPADDLMTFCHGVDIIGNLHIGGGSKNDIRKEPVLKKFEPYNYTYVEMKNLASIEKKLLKIDNCRTQNNETKRITHEIIENGSSLSYIKNKKGAQEYIESSKQKSLFGF